MVRKADGRLHLSEDHAYYAQVQGEMAVMQVDWCDLVVFSGGALAVDRVSFNADYWEKNPLAKAAILLHSPCGI